MKKHIVKILIVCLIASVLLGLQSCAYRYPKTAEGKTLWRYGTEEIPYTLNPYGAEDASAHAVFSLIYDSLFALDAETDEIAPSLCESYEITSVYDDCFLWEITLREDVYWSNGKKLTSADVAFSLQSLYDFSYSHSQTDCVVYNPVSIEEPDDYHINIVVYEQESDVLQALSQLPILPKEIWNELDYMNYDYRGLAENYLQAYTELYLENASATNMIGTGPYQFVSYLDDVCTLSRNEEYFGTKGNTEVIEIHFGLTNAKEEQENGNIEEVL